MEQHAQQHTAVVASMQCNKRAHNLIVFIGSTINFVAGASCWPEAMLLDIVVRVHVAFTCVPML
jgi:hypothetical protein